MTPFTTLTSVAAPLIVDNIDTDMIIPSREMKSTGKTGLADGLFAPWRYADVDARINDPAFVLNQRDFIGTRLLLTGRNFGCGSSREHAVWALKEFGIDCIIAASFAPIFYNNCIRNGLLPVVLDESAMRGMIGHIVTVDLAAQTAGGHHFAIGSEEKQMLIEGLDAIDLTLKHRAEIAAWQAADRKARPWIYLSSPSQSDGEGDHAKHGGGVKRLPPKTNAAIIRAKALGRNMTPPELRLWTALRRRPDGLKFRKQHPAGPFTLDFYCPAARLCIEVDGLSHSIGKNPAKDAARDAFFEAHGIKTLRIPAPLIKDRLEDVIMQIVTEVMARIPLHHPADGPPPHSANGEESE
ncbi:MAG: 3-isopropylmalate dehydratase small subunit [Sphingopyxis sp.]|nr:3-isopropylmalate dehydratase small subunit [Sphingopyxis sp.]